MPVLILAALTLAACSVDMGGFAFTKDKPELQTAAATASEPVLAQDGRCTADRPADPAALRNSPQTVDIGISECDLVRLKGPPTDVLIGADGKGQREVQVLYQEPTGKKLYLFSANRLTRVVD